ncbi:MAG: flagellar hook-basal body complex protein [Calditrichaeota bacterium]|nr:flagellar hook-basal body complex protein [Calditrichota bacterium]
MLRSLFSGVSGLRNHQIQMDVIGNNIANVNTIGFKAGRVTFQESLSQALQNGRKPSGNMGGINPMNVGLGMTVASVDHLFTQGNLERTGNPLDLAIQGNAFFVLNDGNNDYFTRAGNFQIDAAGNLVFGNSGYHVQGRMADSNGEISSAAQVQDVRLPFGQKVAAKATTLVNFSGNLNFDTFQRAQTLSSSYATNAKVVGGALTAPLDLTTANELTVTIDDDGGSTISETLTLNPTTYGTVSAVVAAINQQIQSNRALNGEVIAEVVNDGGNEKVSIHTTDKGGSTTTLALSGSATTPLSLSTSAVTGTVATTALKDLNFISENLSTGDEIRINGTNHNSESISGTYTYTDGDTVQDLLDKMKEIFSDASVSLAADGTLKIEDAMAGASKTTVSMTFFDKETSTIAIMPTFDITKDGRDAGEHESSISAYDSKGATHTVTLKFTNNSTTDEPDLWRWEAIVDNGEIVPDSGNRGVAKFNPNGSLAYFQSEDGLPLTFEPGNGATTMSITVGAGKANSFSGLTQLKNPTTAVVTEQDGYGLGDLYDISFDTTGKVTGHFTNGVSQVLAQVALATFSNEAGLADVGENMFTVGDNSGMAIKGWAGTTVHADIAAGHLEMSNVDLAQEFTNMIVAQRGFQANARVITTSDTLLDEIVRLKR